MLVWVFVTGCQPTTVQDPSDTVLSLEDGSYAVTTGTIGLDSADVCAAVRVVPPPGSGLAARTITDLTLRLRRPPSKTDTLRVDATVSPL